MENKVPVYEVQLPEYRVNDEPDHEHVGKPFDEFVRAHFMGEHIAVRCLGSSQHPGKTVDEMIEIIAKLGYDRYDPNRLGDRYENNERKKIDFFAMDYTVTPETKIFGEFTWPFYHWHIKIHGKPTKIDLVLIYDPAKLKQIHFTYPGREHEGERSDGWVFKDPTDRVGALKAIIKIV